MKGRVYIINTANNSIVGKIIFPTNLFYNSGTMTADNSGNAYVIGVDPVSYLGGPVHKIIVATDSLILNYRPGVFYGIAFNSYTNELFLADAQNFASPGNVLIVKEDGTLNGAFSAQIGPSTFAFRWQ